MYNNISGFVQKSFSIRCTGRVYLFCRRCSKNIFCVLYYFCTGNFKTFFGNLFKFRIIFLLCRDIRQLSTLCYILQQNRHPALLPRKRFFKLFSDFIPNVVIYLRTSPPSRQSAPIIAKKTNEPRAAQTTFVLQTKSPRENSSRGLFWRFNLTLKTALYKYILFYASETADS